MAFKQTVVHVTHFSPQAPAEAVQVVEADLPEPKEGEVLVKMTLMPVHPADLLSLQALLDTLQIPEGQWLINTAASSVLGRMVIKLAKKRGVKTVNLVRRREVVPELQALGADAVVVTTEEDVVARIKEITGGAGAYAAVDAVGGHSTGKVVSATRDGGTVLVYGVLESVQATISIPDLFARDVRVHGFWLNRWVGSLGPRAAEVASEVFHLMAEGVLEPHCGRHFPLKEVKEAIVEAARPGRGGKVLLDPSSGSKL